MDMKLRFYLSRFLCVVLFSAVLFSCTSDQNKTVSLGSFTEHDVGVSLSLIQNHDGNYFVSATFIPPDGYHLYSKDIPATGIDDLGRPTLIELTSNSLMKATGALRENVKPQAPDFEPRDLQVYPAGPVTLRLPVELPAGEDWIDDEISITYMACSAGTCKPPVVGRIVKVRIPGLDMSSNQ